MIFAQKKTALLALTALFFSPLLLMTLPAQAHEYKVGSIEIEHPHAAPTRDGQPNGSLYFHAIENKGSQDDMLISATTKRAKRMEVHEMSMSNNIMTMREIPGIPLPAKTKVPLMRGNPKGYHLMLMGLGKALTTGETFDVVLRFKQAGEVTVKVEVHAAKNSKDHDQHHGHGHGKKHSGH
jgi:periplasmic copper chaperone A